MANTRQSPRTAVVLGVLVLAGSVGAAAWWSQRPTPAPPAALAPDELDVYCSGRVDAPGQVVALEPAAPGRVVKVHVVEGARVEKDQELLTLDSGYADARLKQAEAAAEAAGVELAQAKRLIERFPGQIAGRTALAAAAAARSEAARQALAQRKVQAQAGPPLGAAELAAAAAEVVALEQLEVGERAGLADFKALGAELDLRVRAAEARVKAAQAEQAAAQKARQDCVLRAPGPGTVLRLQASAGGLASPGTMAPPVIFAPAGDYVVRAEVDQEALGRVLEGMRADVWDENRPKGPVWKGTVRTVAGWVAQRRALVLEPGEIADVRTVECVIDIAPGGERLWVGQRMRVRVVRGSAAPGAAVAAAGR